MICCEQDMSFSPITCVSSQRPEPDSWIQVTGVLENRYSEKFHCSQLCLQVQTVEEAEAPQVEVATYG